MKYQFQALLLTVGFLVATPLAQAVEGVDFRNSGEFRARYINDINSTGRDSGEQNADTTARLRWNMLARRGETLQAYLGLLHVSRFGSEQTQTGDYSSMNTHNTILVNRAWGWWRAADSLSVQVGRFGIAIADGSVFSENDWENIPTAHEGLNLVWDLDFATISAFAVKTHEFENAPNSGLGSDPERNLYLVSLDLKDTSEILRTANLSFAQIIKSETSGTLQPPPLGEQNIQQISGYVGGDIRWFLYKISLSYQAGVYNKVGGAAPVEAKLNSHMVDTLFGVQLAEAKNFKFTIGYHMDSGDTDPNDANVQTYLPYYYDRHSFAGLMDVVSWGNLTYFNVNSSFQPNEDLVLGAGYYLFNRTQATDATNPFAREDSRFTTLNTDVAASEKNLGSEIDLYAEQSYQSGLKLRASFGAFFPGDYLRNGSVPRERPLLQAMVQGAMAF